MGLMYAPIYFQFVVKSVPFSEPGSCPFPIVVYLDDIAMDGDTKKQMVEYMLEIIKQLAMAGLCPTCVRAS